jgi:hypothetical protein
MNRPIKCRWFVMCENHAVTTEPHPTLGAVPICRRCANKVAALRGPSPWVQRALNQGRSVPNWMQSLGEKDFNETLALREQAFPSTKRGA